MALLQDVPVEAPGVRVPVAGLRGGFGGTVDADLPGLQVDGGAGEEGTGDEGARLAAVLDPLGDGGEGAVKELVSLLVRVVGRV